MQMLKSILAQMEYCYVVNRFSFNTRARQPSESIVEYIAELRKLALSCNFGNRDRLICGVNQPGIQRKLLSEGELSFEQALAIAQSIETAKQDAPKLAGGTPSQPLSQLHVTKKTSMSPTPAPTCYRCSGPHLATHCRHKNSKCRYFKKLGHLAKVCRAKARSKSAGATPSTPEETPPK